MTLVDSSVWIEFLRAHDNAARQYLRDHLASDVQVCEPVLMEVLAGAAPGRDTQRTQSLLLSQGWHHVHPLIDYRAAVDIFHATRATGHQPRSLQDCLIAAVALRVDVPLAHRDVDYQHIAAATGLRVVDLRG